MWPFRKNSSRLESGILDKNSVFYTVCDEEWGTKRDLFIILAFCYFLGEYFGTLWGLVLGLLQVVSENQWVTCWKAFITLLEGFGGICFWEFRGLVLLCFSRCVFRSRRYTVDGQN